MVFGLLAAATSAYLSKDEIGGSSDVPASSSSLDSDTRINFSTGAFSTGKLFDTTTAIILGAVTFAVLIFYKVVK